MNYFKKIFGFLFPPLLDRSKFKTIKYRNVYASGGWLDEEGDTILYCEDMIIGIPATSRKELKKYSKDFDPKLDYVIFDKSDLKGIKDIIVG